MWASKRCIAQLSRFSAPGAAARAELPLLSQSTTTTINSTLIPSMQSLQIRHAAQWAKNKAKHAAMIKKKGGSSSAVAKKKKARTEFIQYDLKDAEQYSLVDAMRYIRAFEVGQDGKSVKYELALKMKTLKNGPVVRNRLRLPYAVGRMSRVCVICPKDSQYAKEALEQGAVAVGEDEIFAEMKEGNIPYDIVLCQTDSMPKLAKAQLGRVLGPKGLMPNAKQGTLVANPAAAIRDMMGASQYREKIGVVRMAIGQLDFTPEQLQKNIKAVIDAIKKDMSLIADKSHKDIHEVVLSATHSPGFSLNGTFMSPDSKVTPEQLSTR